jgi:hypothetical protein
MNIAPIIEMTPKFESLNVLEIGLGDIRLIPPYAKHLKSIDGRINSFVYLQENYDNLQSTIASLNLDNCSLKMISSFDKAFRLKTREYEMAVITNILHCDIDRETLLKKVYHSLENSGELIIIADNEKEDYQTLYTQLDDLGFVAMNQTECDENYYFVTAKKMHHWGRGL